MAKRRTRVKLSKAQTLENETNKWLAKRDGAIAMLVKAMGKLVQLDRSTRRLQKAALNPPKPPAPITETPPVAVTTVTKPKRQPKPKVGWVFPEAKSTKDVTDIPNSEIFGVHGDTEKRMVSMGFRKTKKRSVAGEVARMLGEKLS